jgi:hypothetical protein
VQPRDKQRTPIIISNRMINRNLRTRFGKKTRLDTDTSSAVRRNMLIDLKLTEHESCEEYIYAETSYIHMAKKDKKKDKEKTSIVFSIERDRNI